MGNDNGRKSRSPDSPNLQPSHQKKNKNSLKPLFKLERHWPLVRQSGRRRVGTLERQGRRRRICAFHRHGQVLRLQRRVRRIRHRDLVRLRRRNRELVGKGGSGGAKSDANDSGDFHERGCVRLPMFLSFGGRGGRPGLLIVFGSLRNCHSRKYHTRKYLSLTRHSQNSRSL
jgi:hypothetical protein